MAPEWVAASAGIIGALGAVLVQGLLGYFTGVNERKRELLLQAYQALIEATASLAAGDNREGGRRDLIAAKQRILYFGPSEVVHALAEFGRTSQKMADPEAVAAFAHLLRAMRSSLDLPAVDDRDLLRVLVGRDQLAAPSQREMDKPGGSSVA
jgi:hypothetical protein